LKCRVQPRSSRNAVAGIYGEAVKITLTAPPVDGKANKALLKFLSVFFKLAPGSLQITAGESSRNKTVFIPDSKDTVIGKLCSGH
ncbi:MAG: DUF167 domain-containing protein, partial [Victivallaceae bacterium]|nr:DUF167 domain-containing protein [Victivallaceae bacterium]